MSKRCVIIQGPTHDYERMSKAWEGFDIIYSTWEGEEEKAGGRRGGGVGR